LNPLYQYIIYAILALVIIGIISYKLYKIYQERGEIKLSKELGENFKFFNKESKKVDVEEEVNEIRTPKQAELNLIDENEGKFIVLYLAAQLENKPELDLIKQKLAVNDLIFKDGYFESEDNSNNRGFRIINREQPGVFEENEPISLMAIVLHLKGQRNVTKTFDQMLLIGRKISESFDMKLLDDNFNSLSEQTISNYRDTASKVDLKTGSYVS
jgi:FtsZ-interacting cell division protein ZipA